MIDLKASNEKLVDRAERIFCSVTGADKETAADFLDKAQKDTKLAIMMYLSGMESSDAKHILETNNGVLKLALKKYHAGITGGTRMKGKLAKLGARHMESKNSISVDTPGCDLYAFV